MQPKERQGLILDELRKSEAPISGAVLSRDMKVSRQIIVQDISKLREDGFDIISTNKGYVLHEIPVYERVFKVIHKDEETAEELRMIVDAGGCVKDVFVYHKAYGVVKAELGIQTHQEIDHFMENIRTGKSTLLMNVTSGYHYHTVCAGSKEQLDMIQDKLGKRGFLAKLQDYEPVDFWTKADTFRS